MREPNQQTVPPPEADPVRPDVFGLRTLIVNVGFIGEPKSDHWVLVDAGLKHSASHILDFARDTFIGPPKAILLTHGHFDHVGALETLLEKWECPVYAHENELPYLKGQANYPPGDPTVGGGLMAWISPIYPHEGIDLGGHVHPLPSGGEIPFLEEWTWVETPGHAPGHVSFFRKKDRTLITGDAFITVKQESALSVLTQKQEIHGPPTYFTPDWEKAKRSVHLLHSLNPEVALTGHGKSIKGEALHKGLSQLDAHFDELAIPDHGRYVPEE